MYLANDSLLITFTLILWSFRIFKRPDTPIDSDVYTDTLISRPFPLEMDFLLRMMTSPEGNV